MKKAGLLGGMSWESTVTYYQIINRIVGQQLGGNHSAALRLLLRRGFFGGYAEGGRSDMQ